MDRLLNLITHEVLMMWFQSKNENGSDGKNVCVYLSGKCYFVLLIRLFQFFIAVKMWHLWYNSVCSNTCWIYSLKVGMEILSFHQVAKIVLNWLRRIFFKIFRNWGFKLILQLYYVYYFLKKKIVYYDKKTHSIFILKIFFL